MAYKVTRKVFVRFQPRWMTRFLINLSPKVYEVVDTLEDARQHLQAIKDAVISSRLIGNSSRLHLVEDEDSIIFLSGSERPYVKFHIQPNYHLD